MPQNDKRPRLTPTEARILALVDQGLVSKEIGRQLGLSPHTVDTHCRNASKKLGVSGRRAAGRAWKARTSEPTQRLSSSISSLADSEANAADTDQSASDERMSVREAVTPFRHVFPPDQSPVGRWRRWFGETILAAFEGEIDALSVRDKLRLIVAWTLGVVFVLFLAFAAFKVASD